VRDTGFVSGRSSHEDRLATIKAVYQRYGVMIDPHTADGVKVGLEHRDPLVPLICLETALPVKFAATLRAALGREPERPSELADLEKRPQRCHIVPNDVAALKRYIESAA
jgi:threonine synthase